MSVVMVSVSLSAVGDEKLAAMRPALADLAHGLGRIGAGDVQTWGRAAASMAGHSLMEYKSLSWGHRMLRRGSFAAWQACDGVEGDCRCLFRKSPGFRGLDLAIGALTNKPPKGS